jgi:hypothetical protein
MGGAREARTEVLCCASSVFFFSFPVWPRNDERGPDVVPILRTGTRHVPALARAGTRGRVARPGSRGRHVRVCPEVLRRRRRDRRRARLAVLAAAALAAGTVWRPPFLSPAPKYTQHVRATQRGTPGLVCLAARPRLCPARQSSPFLARLPPCPPRSSFRPRTRSRCPRTARCLPRRPSWATSAAGAPTLLRRSSRRTLGRAVPRGLTWWRLPSRWLVPAGARPPPRRRAPSRAWV